MNDMIFEITSKIKKMFINYHSLMLIALFIISFSVLNDHVLWFIADILLFTFYIIDLIISSIRHNMR